MLYTNLGFLTRRCETLESTQSPKIRRLSFAFPVEPMSPQSKHDSGDGQGSQLDPALLSKELTCISEEGLADMDFQVLIEKICINQFTIFPYYLLITCK